VTDPTTASTPTLQARAASALLRLVAFDQKQRSQAETSAIEAARLRSESSLDTLNSALTARDELVRLGVLVPQLDNRRRKDAADGRRALRSAAAAFLDPEASLTNRLTGDSVQGALKQSEDICRVLVRLMNDAVDAERVRLRPLDLEKPIPELPNKYATYRRLCTVKLRLEAKVEGFGSSELVGKLEDLRKGVSTWTTERPELEEAAAVLQPEIRKFVEMAGTDAGVPWARLSAEVRAWLDEDGHGEIYRVRRL
jgi:hypothetical protein